VASDLEAIFSKNNLKENTLKQIASSIKEEERMDFTDINNYDMKEEDENEEEIDVVSKRYNPYTIIFQIVT
jgi:hypothetical protein